jgi:2,4-dienoyl-CoA reductase (NADPH2)
VLSGKAHTGQRVVIIGGGAVGVETALFLAEKGTLSGEALKFLLTNRAEDPAVLYDLSIRGTKSVVLVEMIAKVGQDIGRSTRWSMLQELVRVGVKTKTATKALAIVESGVKVEKDGEEKIIKADTVVIAAGSVSYNPLEDVLKAQQIPYQVVGDAKQVARAFEAVHAGYAAGNTI